MPLDSSPFIPDFVLQAVKDNRYAGVRKVPGNGWCGLLQFVYTWAVVVNLTPEFYERRYCYEHEDDASQALAAWDGQGHPTGPWIKCKGAGIDLLNPDLKEF